MAALHTAAVIAKFNIGKRGGTRHSAYPGDVVVITVTVITTEHTGNTLLYCTS